MKNKIIALIAGIVFSFISVHFVFAEYYGRRVRWRVGHTVRTKKHLEYQKNKQEAIRQQKYLKEEQRLELQQKRIDDAIKRQKQYEIRKKNIE